MLSGEEVASIGVEGLSDAKALKQELNRKQGLPLRFRQRLFHRGTAVDDATALDTPMELQLVLLPYSATSQMQAEELATASADGSVSEARVVKAPRP